MCVCFCLFFVCVCLSSCLIDISACALPITLHTLTKCVYKCPVHTTTRFHVTQIPADTFRHYLKCRRTRCHSLSSSCCTHGGHHTLDSPSSVVVVNVHILSSSSRAYKFIIVVIVSIIIIDVVVVISTNVCTNLKEEPEKKGEGREHDISWVSDGVVVWFFVRPLRLCASVFV